MSSDGYPLSIGQRLVSFDQVETEMDIVLLRIINLRKHLINVPVVELIFKKFLDWLVHANVHWLKFTGTVGRDMNSTDSMRFK